MKNKEVVNAFYVQALSLTKLKSYYQTYKLKFNYTEPALRKEG